MSLSELSKRYFNLIHPTLPIPDTNVLEWVNNEPVYFNDIETLYSLPEWVIKAVERQKVKFYGL